jgi:NAD(P)-dependent dehydrogenase (short-subunit alcohol dehydrogenase family)
MREPHNVVSAENDERNLEAAGREELRNLTTCSYRKRITMNERRVSGGNYVFFGGSTGIGHAAAVELGRRGANVLIVGRGREAGEVAVEAVRAAGGEAAFLSADLSNLRGVKAAAEGVIAWRPVLHGVMHTAMAAFKGKTLTADGLEFAFALQYMARAALNRALSNRSPPRAMDVLLASRAMSRCLS